jgi:hypothetical protein
MNVRNDLVINIPNLIILFFKLPIQITLNKFVSNLKHHEKIVDSFDCSGLYEIFVQSIYTGTK